MHTETNMFSAYSDFLRHLTGLTPITTDYTKYCTVLWTHPAASVITHHHAGQICFSYCTLVGWTIPKELASGSWCSCNSVLLMRQQSILQYSQVKCWSTTQRSNKVWDLKNKQKSNKIQTHHEITGYTGSHCQPRPKVKKKNEFKHEIKSQQEIIPVFLSKSQVQYTKYKTNAVLFTF